MTNQLWCDLPVLHQPQVHADDRLGRRARIQGIWIIYAIVTRQWGFIASAVAYGLMYGKNLLAWRRETGVKVPSDG